MLLLAFMPVPAELPVCRLLLLELGLLGPASTGRRKLASRLEPVGDDSGLPGPNPEPPPDPLLLLLVLRLLKDPGRGDPRLLLLLPAAMPARPVPVRAILLSPAAAVAAAAAVRMDSPVELAELLLLAVPLPKRLSYADDPGPCQPADGAGLLLLLLPVDAAVLPDPRSAAAELMLLPEPYPGEVTAVVLKSFEAVLLLLLLVPLAGPLQLASLPAELLVLQLASASASAGFRLPLRSALTAAHSEDSLWHQDTATDVSNVWSCENPGMLVQTPRVEVARAIVSPSHPVNILACLRLFVNAKPHRVCIQLQTACLGKSAVPAAVSMLDNLCSGCTMRQLQSPVQVFSSKGQFCLSILLGLVCCLKLSCSCAWHTSGLHDAVAAGGCVLLICISSPGGMLVYS